MLASKHSIALFMALALGFLFPIAAMAQVDVTGELRGVVRDPSGAVVPGAQVELKDQATGITKDAKSDAEGAFQFFGLTFGKYQVSSKGYCSGIPDCSSQRRGH